MSKLTAASGKEIIQLARDRQNRFIGRPITNRYQPNPVYATGVGLVLQGLKRQERGVFRVRDDNIFSKVRHRMSDWLSDFF